MEGDRMPLNEREQRILDEIERQLYEEDPKLAKAVAKASPGARSRRRQRLAIAGFVLGLVLMLGSFTRSPLIAGIGFAMMVASAGWIAMGIRAARTEGGSGSIDGWLDRAKQRWRRDG
jgi:hypothetical protein